MKFSNSLVLSCSLVACGLAFAQTAWCIDVDVAEAPANDLALTLSAINSAQQSLQLNIYELSSPDIANALISRIQAGVQVQILEEGQPVGGMSTASKGIVSQLVQAMQGASSGDFLYEMTSKATPKAKRRFRYDHAKYMVIDGSSILVGSENYSPTGNPEPGTVGNRGWEALIHDPSLAQSFAQIFAADSDPSNPDILNMSSQSMAYVFGVSDSIGKKPKPKPEPQPLPPPIPSGSDTQTLSASAVASFTSPNTSLSGLQALFDNATTSIDIELMTFNSSWGKGGGQSPLLASLLSAARRGVKVRVLLNDESVFNEGVNPDDTLFSKPTNLVTLQALRNAAAQGLPIQALVANIKAMGVDYIHNKGAIVDGDMTMISSINWDENSVEHNREAAVVITSPDIYNHYEALFEQDWEASGGSGASRALLRARAPMTEAVASVIDCPSSVDLRVQIGSIAVPTGQDPGFSSLEGQSFELHMTRAKASSGSSCIFIDSGHSARQRVFEIRHSSGRVLFILEGYTSDGKIYSIRSRSGGLESSQDLDARVYEGSGGHEALGVAEMQIDAN